MGMTPFAYRLMGNIAGILMILVMYIFGKTVFKSRKCAILAAFLMAFDNFHFAQTRLGTVDSHLVLFIMISSLFMYRFLLLDKDAPLKKKLINLFFCGLFFGFATCVKWTGLYCGLGLAIVFFAKIIYDIVKSRQNDKQNITIKLDKNLIKILGSCVIFFIVIPCIFYVLCYLLFPKVVNYGENSIFGIFKQIHDMYIYHSTLNATHPFASNWYTWPFMITPVWYFVSNVSDTVKSTVVGIGNPAIWWFGVLAINIVIASIRYEKIKRNVFIIIMFLAVWLPYMFIGRIMYMYHFFPALPFLMLAIVSVINRINKKWFTLFYMATVLITFFAFLPVVSGSETTVSYVESLKWLKTWIF